MSKDIDTSGKSEHQEAIQKLMRQTNDVMHSLSWTYLQQQYFLQIKKILSKIRDDN